MVVPGLIVLLATLAAGQDGAAPAPLEPPEAAAAGNQEPSDRVQVFSAADPEYARLPIPREGRLREEAEQHLVVFHQGSPVLDFGLRNELGLAPPAGQDPKSLQETGRIDTAAVSADGRSAVVLSTSYRRDYRPSGRQPDPKAPPPSGATEILWIDAARPGERWKLAIEDGRWVRAVIPLSSGRGVVLSTMRGEGAPADLRVLGPDGKTSFKMSEVEASAGNITATIDGRFVAVDLLYTQRRDFPDRGVLVLDLVRGTRWAYTWSYGGDDEPVSWNLDEAGTLDVETPGAHRRYDSTGAPVRSRR